MISAGLPPKRIGGIPLYVTDLRKELVERGYDVFYLDTNCQDESRKPSIRQTSDSPREYSFFNSGSRNPVGVMPHPLSEVHASRESKKCFLEFVGSLKPDVIHFHEALCIPLDLVSALRARGYKVIFTAQDYFSVCPTIQLFTHDHRLCTLQTDELQCDKCVRTWPVTRLQTHADWANPLVAGSGLFARICRALLRLVGLAVNPMIVRRAYGKDAYRVRRIEAVKHLRAFNLVICMSKMQHSLIKNIVGDGGNLRQIYLSLASCEQARMHRPLEPFHNAGGVIRFVALNTNQINKGGDVLLNEFRSLRAEMSNVELHLFGDTKIGEADGVFYHGSYERSELNTLLASMDVGVIPSLWPEAYAYVGPEMLMRGIPLIVSVAGAMPEYVIPRVNGLYFDPATPGSLKLAMKALATDPPLLQELKVQSSSSSDGIVSFKNHVSQMESIYAEVCCV